MIINRGANNEVRSNHIYNSKVLPLLEQQTVAIVDLDITFQPGVVADPSHHWWSTRRRPAILEQTGCCHWTFIVLTQRKWHFAAAVILSQGRTSWCHWGTRQIGGNDCLLWYFDQAWLNRAVSFSVAVGHDSWWWYSKADSASSHSWCQL